MLAFVYNGNSVFAAIEGSGAPDPTKSISGSGGPPPAPAKIYTPLQNPLKAKSVEGVIFLAVDIAIYIGTAFAILAIIYAGFKMIMAQGNSDAIKEAREWLLYIAIGLAILLSSRLIVEIIRNTLVQSGVVNEKILK